MSNTSAMDLLAVGAHPDDVELFCGGLLAKSSAGGKTVAVLDLTRGELSSQGTLETRELETKRASELLGLRVRENLDIPDGQVGLEADSFVASAESQLGKSVAALRRLRPSLLLLPYLASRHPDHAASGELLTKAAFFSSVKKFLPEAGVAFSIPQILYYQMRASFEPSFVCDISEVFETKRKAIQAYSSQITREPGSQTLVSSPLSLSSVESRDAYYGSMVGSTHAEPYFTRNIIGIDDPIAFFASRQGKEALLYPNTPKG